MKQWFPFTDYDFYAYLTAGMLLIAAVDYTFGGGVLVGREQWTVVQIVFWTAAAYVAGQLIAGPSASLLEHTIARRLLYPPTQILLGVRERRRRERLLSLIAGRHYEPFPAPMRAQLLSRAAAAYATSPADFHDAEATFQAAYASARNSSDTSQGSTSSGTCMALAVILLLSAS